jgi:outer membrane protein OmpA-like peptidoglycan-associated protein
MSQGKITRRMATAGGAMALFAAGAAKAQSTEEMAPGSNTFPVHFATGSYQLTGKDNDTIRGAAAYMMRDTSLNATIIGKTDTTGSADFNHHLSELRAKAVFEALVYTNNVPEDRVTIRWAGEMEPYVSTADDTPEMLNRVVAIVLK